MKKLILACIGALCLTSCVNNPYGPVESYKYTDYYVHIQISESKIRHVMLKNFSITSEGVVIGSTISGEDIILSPGTYVLYKTQSCIVC